MSDPDDRAAEEPEEAPEGEAHAERRLESLPAPDVRTGEAEIVSPKGRRYSVIRTDELDPYEQPPERAEKPDESAP